MDKLEKAIEKARLQRGIGSAASHGEAIRFEPISGLPLKPSASRVSSSVAIDDEQLERHRVLAHRARCVEADMFRLLRTQVLQMMLQSGYKTLAITSPNYGDGKTTIALNLAISIILDLKQTVLLVDLDLRKPNVHEFLGVQPSAGLSDYLTSNKPLSDCLLRFPFDRLSFLPAGTPLDHSSEVLGSPKMAALARELKTRYPDRLVIYDMPPVLVQDDPLAFLPHVDSALLVVRDGVTKTSEVTRCLEVLAGANLIGTVLNNAL